MNDLSKYDLLREFLNLNKEEEVKLTLRQIEIIINDKLPPAAYTYYSWWNDTDYHSGLRTWKKTDWRAEVHTERGKIAWVNFRCLK